jgi:hypothetical protein
MPSVAAANTIIQQCLQLVITIIPLNAFDRCPDYKVNKRDLHTASATGAQKPFKPVCVANRAHSTVQQASVAASAANSVAACAAKMKAAALQLLHELKAASASVSAFAAPAPVAAVIIIARQCFQFVIAVIPLNGYDRTLQVYKGNTTPNPWMHLLPRKQQNRLKLPHKLPNSATASSRSCCISFCAGASRACPAPRCCHHYHTAGQAAAAAWPGDATLGGGGGGWPPIQKEGEHKPCIYGLTAQLLCRRLPRLPLPPLLLSSYSNASSSSS